jgi:hypothetical protein
MEPVASHFPISLDFGARAPHLASVGAGSWLPLAAGEEVDGCQLKQGGQVYRDSRDTGSTGEKEGTSVGEEGPWRPCPSVRTDGKFDQLPTEPPALEEVWGLASSVDPNTTQTP